jgi:hypothetical protein
VIIGPWPVPSTKCSGLDDDDDDDDDDCDDDDDDCDYDIESVNEFTEDTIGDMLINVFYKRITNCFLNLVWN